MSACIGPCLPGTAWQKRGVVAPACALKSTAPTSSRDGFAQHDIAIAAQLYVVMASQLASSEIFAAGVGDTEISSITSVPHQATLQVLDGSEMAGDPSTPSLAKGDLNLARGDF